MGAAENRGEPEDRRRRLRDVVVAWIDFVWTVRSTGKTIEGPLVCWMTLRDGKLATLDEFEHDTHDAWT